MTTSRLVVSFGVVVVPVGCSCFFCSFILFLFWLWVEGKTASTVRHSSITLNGGRKDDELVFVVTRACVINMIEREERGEDTIEKIASQSLLLANTIS
jgi:hypothetical protein